MEPAAFEETALAHTLKATKIPKWAQNGEFVACTVLVAGDEAPAMQGSCRCLSQKALFLFCFWGSPGTWEGGQLRGG